MVKLKCGIARLSVLFICALPYLLSGCGDRSYFEVANAAEESEADVTLMDAADESTVDETEPATVFVQVAGAVNSPGVYELDANARVFTAIEAAGGVTADADVRDLNQALFVSDGQMIYVYAKGERAEAEASQEDDGLIDINSAGAEALMTLPGIGSEKANAIIAYRENNGRFSSTDELMKISGIKSGVYDKIKDLITAR